MKRRVLADLRVRSYVVGAALAALLSSPLLAQGPPAGRGGGPPPTGKAAAQIDLTGYWVSVVSEDWRWRMITPPKGDYANIPVNPAGKAIGDVWDPAKDDAAGDQCKAYAAPAIMREPGRLHITWDDDNTLKMETDAGQQTRIFRFGPPAAATTDTTAQRSWQGVSVARWEPAPRPFTGGGLPVGLGPRAGNNSRTLEVTTTQIRPGYLRKNGIPFSAQATMTEYFDMFKEPNGGADWFTVTTVVTDPQYLTAPWVTSTNFKREPDGSKFAPAPCKVR